MGVRHPGAGTARATDGRGPATVVALLALTALGTQLLSLSLLEWYDAYVESLLSLLRGYLRLSTVRSVTQTAPWIAAAFVLWGTLVARARRATRSEVLSVLLALGAALAVVQALKLGMLRDRPASFHQEDSFPSGHTAHVALCVAAAIRLVGLRARRRDPVLLAMAIAGPAAALAIGVSRLALGRHWLTDVTTSLLLGIALWGLLGQRARWRLATAPVALGLLALAASGVHVRLPSPVTFDDQTHFDLPVSRDVLASGSDRLWMWTRPASHALLQIAAVPVGPRDGTCYWLAVRIDGQTRLYRAGDGRRRTFAFPLPLLAGGVHRVQLRSLSGCTRVPARRAPLAVTRLSVEGATGRFLEGILVSHRVHLPHATNGAPARPRPIS